MGPGVGVGVAFGFAVGVAVALATGDGLAVAAGDDVVDGSVVAGAPVPCRLSVLVGAFEHALESAVNTTTTDAQRARRGIERPS
jgi:hypothetical protein